jgi:putative nucleotidyltransferase with HDIG domain
MALALIFAALAFTIVRIETWIPSWRVVPGEAAPVTVRLPSTYFRITLLRNEVHYLSTISSTCPNLLGRGETIKKGSECAGLVQAFEAKKRSVSTLQSLGLFSFYFSLGLIMAAFMRHRTIKRARLLRGQAGAFFLIILGMITAKAVFLFTEMPSISAPVLFVSLLAGFFYRRRTAVVVVLAEALTVSSLVNFDIELFLLLAGAGLLGAVLAHKRVQRNRTLLKAGVFSGWFGLLFLVITTLVFSGGFGIYDDPAEHLDPRYSLWIGIIINGVMSSVIAVVLAPIIGRVVGEVSRNRLTDLQDLDQRLLKRIQEKAPGTWEHSRAMANLAEAAVNSIGGNTALVRVGAYYHDVGKSNAAEYFIENQAGKGNPHDDLEPEESASMIFKHVIDGAKMLRQEGIPEDVVEFCYSHHGTSVLEYFWHKTMASGNPNDFTEKDFTYPGYKPTTRETGILMLVDAIEAGARTVDVPDKDKFSDLVRTIVFSKLSQGQLDDSGLSLGDLRIVVNTLVDTLVNMYHARIKYPWQTGDTPRHRISSPPPLDDGESVSVRIEPEQSDADASEDSDGATHRDSSYKDETSEDNTDESYEPEKMLEMNAKNAARDKK